MSILPVLNQGIYPLARDWDDCWVVATVWAAVGARRSARKPTVFEFRRAASNPDDPYRPDGGNIDEIARAIPIIWPGQPHHIQKTMSWAALVDHLDRGEYVSIALLSSRLPYSLRYGFRYAHQVGLVKVGSTIYLANPLAPEGSAPQAIREDALRYAVQGVANGWVLAACFPVVASTTTATTGGNVAIRYAQVGTTTTRMALPEGTSLFDKPGGVRVTRMSKAATVPHIGTAGMAGGKSWRAVVVGTSWSYADGKPHRTVLYVPASAGKVVPA